MSEYGLMDCGEFASVAAELALGVLTGRERADALAHLERCDACRETVRQLAMTGEELTSLLPAVEPPAGFETRALARIGIAGAPPAGRRRLPSLLTRPRRPRLPRFVFGWSRRMLAAAAVTLTVLAAGLGGWGLRAATTAAPAPAPASSVPLTSAALVSAGHHTVGKVFYYAGAYPWMYMSVDVPSGNWTVTCQLAGPSGRFTTVGSFRLDAGYGSWGGPSPWPGDTVTGARLVGPGGTVIATARFS